MDLVDSTKEKLDAVLDRIAALKSGDFPHEHSREALGAIEAIFASHRQTIGLLTPASNKAAVNNLCNVVAKALFEYLPFLGFLHRSKNASNAFELYGPLLRLAQQLISRDAKLILSSEWEFSPYSFVGVPRLPDFVWVGLPASESSNALLTPLAGHEFGHSVWQTEDLETRYAAPIDAAIVASLTRQWTVYQTHFLQVPNPAALVTDIFGTHSWRPAHEWALSQAEEVFCDLVGLRIFGAAFVHAFAYLLAPGESIRQTPKYPTLPSRVNYMKLAAAIYGIAVPADFETQFQGVGPLSASTASFLLGIAEEAVASVAPDIIAHVDAIATSRSISKPADAESDAILQSFKILVPDGNAKNLTAIVEAAWKAAQTPSLWSEYPQIAERRRIVLNELVLKTAQVLEFNTLQEAPSP